LERASREAGPGSEIVHHAYTLALHHIKDKQRLADVAFQIAQPLASEDRALAMDYYQRAMFAGLDEARRRHVGAVFEQWASPKATSSRINSQDLGRVAHVIGRLGPNDETTEYLRLLVASLRMQGVESSVFTTEWASAWFFNGPDVARSEPIEIEAEVHQGSVEGDFEARAHRISEAIRSSGASATLYHAGLNETITARVASLRPASVQVNVVHSLEMDMDLFEGRIHLSPNFMRRSRFSENAVWIPPACDIETRLQTGEPLTRLSMGLEKAGAVSATIGPLDEASGLEYLRVLSEILQRFPTHFHLFAGPGNVKAIRSFLHSDGVLPRVRFLGPMGDFAPLIGVIDLYLAPFPVCSTKSPVLAAMGAGKPVVALASGADSPSNDAAEFVGLRELTAARAPEYLSIAERLLRDPSFRAKQSAAVQERFQAEFRPESLGRKYKTFLSKIIESRGA
jgi:glycosyltransferase involved in cell wall biosynthesis